MHSHNYYYRLKIEEKVVILKLTKVYIILYILTKTYMMLLLICR